MDSKLKNMRLLYYILSLSILLLNCTQDSKKTTTVKSINKKHRNETIAIKNENIEVFNVDNSDAEKVLIPSDAFDSDIDMSTLVSNIKLIPLETTPKSIIGKINVILYSNSFYFIHDKRNNKLLRFSEDGKFLNSIGTIGKGPQELLSIYDVAINSDKKIISILDAKSRKISKYTFSGELVDEKPLFYSISQHEYNNDDIIYSVNKSQKNVKVPSINPYRLLLTDKNSVPFGVAFKKPEKINSYNTKNPLRKFDNKIYYHHPYSDGIWNVQNKKLTPIIKFEFEKNGLEKDIWKKNINNKEFKEILSTHAFFSGDYIMTDSFCFFQFFENKKVSNLFFNRKSGSSRYWSGQKYSSENPLNVLITPPVGHKKDDSFISISEAIELYRLKKYMTKNETLTSDFKNSTIWKKMTEIKQTDNPILVTYKVKGF